MSTPNAGTIRHPLYKLEAWSEPLLSLDDPELRRKCIEVCENESPTQSYKIVEALMKLERFQNSERKFSDEKAREMAQSAHHFAAIRRDYGEQAFNRLAQLRK